MKKKFLIIQTAFIGDVILATPVIEKLHRFYPDAEIDFLLRKGNESLLANHPFLRRIIIWDKKQNKISNLYNIIKTVRKNNYDVIIDLHRFFSSGIITALSRAGMKVCFNKNPISFLFTKSLPHTVGNKANPVHEVDRNLSLIEFMTDNTPEKPKLYPSESDYAAVSKYKTQSYICIAPASVWFTKQLPDYKWTELISHLNSEIPIFLLGASQDINLCEAIKQNSKRTNIENLAGSLNLMQSAALIKDAKMNYVNDSAPLHLASAMNAPVTAFFLSTVPEFGFGPLSDNSTIIQTKENLACKPCGIHGFAACPQKHFKCASTILL